MGTYGGYVGPRKISADKIKDFEEAVSKLLYYGGMMHVRQVNMYGKQIMLLDPVKIVEGENLHFHYNYFEDASWETAGYNRELDGMYSNKIGSAEFNDVITAVYCLYEHFDEGIGYAEMNGDIVDSGFYVGWINNILSTQFSLEKRLHIWELAEAYAYEMLDYDPPITYEEVMDMVPCSISQYAGGTELLDLIFVTNGTGDLIDGEVVSGTYPADVLACKRVVKDILRKNGKEEGYRKILSLLDKSFLERKSENDSMLKLLAESSLQLPARVIVYLLCEQLEKPFWEEWKQLKEHVYDDQQMKKYISPELEKVRKEGREQPIEPRTTSEFLRQDGWSAFIDTPNELKGKPKYYLCDADRLFWWDGSDEVKIDERTEQWLLDIKNQYKSILESISDKCDTREFNKQVIELLYDVNLRYERVFAFYDMFYEFIENGNVREYRAAIELLCKLHEDNAESGEIIKTLRWWDVGSKSVKCNEGRMNIKRYLSVLANKQLRRKYLGF